MVATPAGSLAFHESQSSEIVPVEQCLVAHDLINDLLKRPLLKGAGEITIRVGARTGEVAVECHSGELVDDFPANVRRGKKARITETVHGHNFQVSMASFFQNSPEAAESIADSIAHIFDVFEVSGGVLVDAYGGVGLFARLFADRFSEVVVVEGNAASCRDAMVNLDGCAAQIYESPVEEWRAMPADVVIADPSRSGLGKGGVRTLARTGASLIVLVSCDAVAAARDASLFASLGYALHHVEVLDLFPETHHIEVVSVFTR
jgi:23S rRNA (uracil1939-C5)-methyltransferase